MSALGRRQVAVLVEAASEVASACPWLPIAGTRRVVWSLSMRGLVGATHDLFGITARGCAVLRRYDRPLARAAAAGLRRERISGPIP